MLHNKVMDSHSAANLFSESDNNEEDHGDGDPYTCGDSDFEPADQSSSRPTHYSGG